MKFDKIYVFQINHTPSLITEINFNILYAGIKFTKQSGNFKPNIFLKKTARQIISLKLSQRVIGRVDVGEALTQLDRKFDAAEVAMPVYPKRGFPPMHFWWLRCFCGPPKPLAGPARHGLPIF